MKRPTPDISIVLKRVLKHRRAEPRRRGTLTPARSSATRGNVRAPPETRARSTRGRDIPPPSPTRRYPCDPRAPPASWSRRPTGTRWRAATSAARGARPEPPRRTSQSPTGIPARGTIPPPPCDRPPPRRRRGRPTETGIRCPSATRASPGVRPSQPRRTTSSSTGIATPSAPSARRVVRGTTRSRTVSSAAACRARGPSARAVECLTGRARRTSSRGSLPRVVAPKEARCRGCETRRYRAVRHLSRASSGSPRRTSVASTREPRA
mmetsp:Transcript_4261/g.18999  ORF Transcript_4261/g.18999 Transcript_4261/m.18999 type:complete len:266 (+) Transcript_4261:1305-2102(+)